ncbi:unnamed protein product [Dibothriocephalus latus]|uniref:Laminin EGF-like domain-containing protein n=1 Tax=Dibothriocephalus latus TaxID=60516 RepID=A0A3P7NRY3_DIBLA|nr:unnamed protein product [Dibothriocephalus latus]
MLVDYLTKHGSPWEAIFAQRAVLNYAITCHPTIPDDPNSPHTCQCRPGYAGEVCDRCDTGYYGDPLLMVPCKPCGCNPSGSRSQRCNMKTGQCSCLPGIMGRKCDECRPGHVVDGGRCIGESASFLFYCALADSPFVHRST